MEFQPIDKSFAIYQLGVDSAGLPLNPPQYTQFGNNGTVDNGSDKRTEAVTNITVYSNKGIPVLTINGKKAAAPKQATTKVHFIFENVQLQKGKNEIKATVNNSGQKLNDEVEWELE